MNSDGFIDEWTNDQLCDFEARAVARLHDQDRIREAAERTAQQPGPVLHDVQQQETAPASTPRRRKAETLEEILISEGFSPCKKRFRAMKSITIDGEQVRLFCDYPNNRPSFYARSDEAWIERSKVDELLAVRKVWRAFNALGSKKLTDFEDPDIDEDKVREFRERLAEAAERRHDDTRTPGNM